MAQAFKYWGGARREGGQMIHSRAGRRILVCFALCILTTEQPASFIINHRGLLVLDERFSNPL